MTDTPETAGPGPKGRFRRWLLPASLVLNLLLAGVIAGGALSHMHGSGPPHRKFGFGPLEHAVPQQARQKLGPVFERERANMRGAFHELRGARSRMHEAMVKQPYDPDAASRALEEVRDRSAAVQDVLHNLLLSINERLTPEERRQFLDALERPLKRPPSGPER
jgi:uncharacterized membrane protein